MDNVSKFILDNKIIFLKSLPQEQTKDFSYGCNILRINPVINKNGSKDYSYCDRLVKFIGKTGKKIIINDGQNSNITLPIKYSDYNWIMEKDIMSFGKKTLLSYIEDSYIIRIKKLKNDHIANSYMEVPVLLIKAVENYMIIQDGEKQIILDDRYTNPDFWRQVKDKK